MITITITVAATTGGSFNVEVAIVGSNTAPVVDICALGIDIATAVLNHLA